MALSLLENGRFPCNFNKSNLTKLITESNCPFQQVLLSRTSGFRCPVEQISSWVEDSQQIIKDNGAGGCKGEWGDVYDQINGFGLF
jgi:hypothetical protein